MDMNKPKTTEMRNALSDAIMIWQKQMLPREFTQYFINEAYFHNQIETMLTHSSNDFKKDDKLVPGLILDNDAKKLLNIYLENQQVINMVVLQGLFDVAYEKHPDDMGNIWNEPRASFITSRDPITKRIREYPKPAIDALRLISTADYEMTLPKFAMWSAYNPHQDLYTMTRSEISRRMLTGFNPAKADYGTSDLMIKSVKTDMHDAESVYEKLLKKELETDKNKDFQSGSSTMRAAAQHEKVSKTNFNLLNQKTDHNK